MTIDDPKLSSHVFGSCLVLKPPIKTSTEEPFTGAPIVIIMHEILSKNEEKISLSVLKKEHDNVI